MTRDDLGLVHRFVPAPPGGDVTTLLLLHGTGGTEEDLLPLGPMLDEGAALLSPRGAALEDGMPRFFARLAPGVFDEVDLRARTDELGDFLCAAAERYRFDSRRVVAVGYSNGANIAAALLLLRPKLLAGAVLFRPMIPLEPGETPDLAGVPVLIASGRTDPTVPRGHPESLAAMLHRGGAEVTLHWHHGGHELDNREIGGARDWLVRHSLASGLRPAAD